MRTRVLHTMSAVLSLFAAFASASAARADILFSQPPTVTQPPGAYNALTSAQVGSGGNVYLTVDNFQLATGATVTGLSYQGAYINQDPSTGQVSNGTPDTLSWTFTVFTGGPGATNLTALQSMTVSAAAVTETLAGSTPFVPFGGSQQININYYNESVTFASPFTLAAGSSYYLGIFSNNGGSNDAYAWFSGSGGDNVSYQSQNGGAFASVANDRTFTLTGQAVPEPGAAALGLVAAAGLILAARRRG